MSTDLERHSLRLLEVDDVSHALLHRVLDARAGHLATALRRVHARDPVVGEPVGEDARVVEAEHVDVCPVHEVVGEDGDVARPEPRPHHADVRRVVAHQLLDESTEQFRTDSVGARSKVISVI